MENIKCVYDPLKVLMEYYTDKISENKIKTKKEKLSVEDILKNRIIDGDKIGIEADLSVALKKYSALDIINNILLDGMKVVGDLFGSGQMQLPFVLQSAECMKSAVQFLEPFMEKTEGESAKGVLVLATVKGDVHDIGKNLVDIILTNNGYKVINLGIKCPLEAMISAFEENNADAIGMSGLLVKSTAIMKENLEQMNERELEAPVILGGAALNRRFVEGDLRKLYKGDVYYANDAFDGLKFMEFILDYKKKNLKPILEIYSVPRKISDNIKNENIKSPDLKFKRSNVKNDNQVPYPPFLGSKIIENISLEKVYEYINEIALFRGSWNIYKDKKKSDYAYEELLKNEVYPKFKELKLRVKREKLLEPKIIYGYFPCQSENNDLIIYKPKETHDPYNEWYGFDFKNMEKYNIEEWVRFTFPRQSKDRFLCISDFFKPVDSNIFDIVAFQIATAGRTASDYSKKLYEGNKYQDYLYFHGFSVESTEALAEYWHKIIREELKINKKDSNDIKKIFQQGYQGSRYSFGYPACPDLEDNKLLFEILKPERIGITLTEEWQMVPEQSTNAIIVHHPEAKYFLIK